MNSLHIYISDLNIYWATKYHLFIFMTSPLLLLIESISSFIPVLDIFIKVCREYDKNRNPISIYCLGKKSSIAKCKNIDIHLFNIYIESILHQIHTQRIEKDCVISWNISSKLLGFLCQYLRVFFMNGCTFFHFLEPL